MINPMHVILRSESKPHFTRMHPVRPTAGERYYIRILLQHIPARSFEQLRTVGNVIHNNYQSAVVALGYFTNDETEAEYAIKEAIDTLKTPHQLRLLFTHLLVNDCINCPVDIWTKYHSFLSKDYFLSSNNDYDSALTATLLHISNLLREHGKTLSDFGLEDIVVFSGEVQSELSRWEEMRPILQDRVNRAVNLLNNGNSVLMLNVFSLYH